MKALPLITFVALLGLAQSPAGSLQVSNAIGIRLAVDDQNALPALRIFLPWIIATFSYDPGNVWVNPDLTCQHADPQISLPRGQSRSIESKTLVIRGNLEAALSKVKQQRTSLQH